jgi:rod shape-determining protein MreD
MTRSTAVLRPHSFRPISGAGRVLSGVGPFLTLACSCLLALQSAGATPSVALVCGLLPTLTIHSWGLARPGSIPLALAFVAGVWVDAVSQGPIGFWALAYVATSVTVDALSSGASRGGLAHALSLVVTLAVVTSILWVVSSVYSWQMSPVEPLVTAGVAAAALYGVAQLVWSSLLAMGSAVLVRRTARKSWGSA